MTRKSSPSGVARGKASVPAAAIPALTSTGLPPPTHSTPPPTPPTPAPMPLEHGDGDEMSRGEIEVMLEQLQQGQIALYAKNNELRQLQTQFQALHQRYFDLYNRAPVGYITLDADGFITEANETTEALLGMSAAELRGQPFGWFIAADSQAHFQSCCSHVTTEPDGHSCELAMIRADGSPFWARAVTTPEADTDDVRRVILVDISKRKAVERALQDTEERLHKAFDLNPDLMGISRLSDGKIVSVNKSYTTITGYTAAEAVGHSSLELNRWVNPADYDTLHERLRTDGQVLNWEVPFLTKAGAVQVGLLSAAVIDVGGEAHVITNMRDVTELRRERELLQRSEERFRRLIEASPAPTSVVGDQGIRWYCNKAFTRLFGYRNEDVPTREAWYDTAYPDPEYRQEIAARWREHIATYENTGTFEPVEARVRARDGSDRIVLITASPTNTAFADGYIAIFHDITERKRAEAAARAANEVFKQSFDLSPDAMSVNRLPDQVVVAINSSFTRITGYLPDEIVGRTSLQLNRWIDETVRARFFEQLQRDGSVDGIEVELRNKDGSTMIGLLSAALITIDGKPHSIATYRDFTKQKRAEAVMRENEEKFRKAFDLNPDSMSILRVVDNTLVAVNRGFTELSGHAAVEAVGSSTVPMDRWVDLDQRRRLVEAAAGGETLRNVEVAIRCKDGTVRNCLVSLTPIDINGVVHILSSVRDVTEQRQATRVMEENEEKFRKAFDLSPDSMTIIRAADDTLIAVNRGFTELSGYSAAEALGSHTVPVARWIDPGLRRRLTDAAARGEIVRNVDVSMRRKDGAIRDCLVSMLPVELGGIVHVLSSVRDVTEQRQAMQAMKENEEKFRKAFDVSPDSMVIVRPEDDTLIAVNRGFTQLSGYTYEESVGGNRIPQQRWVNPAVRRQLTEAAARGEVVRNAEVSMRRKDGAVRECQISMVPIDIDGVRHVLSCARDVSDQLRAQRALEESEEKFRRAFDVSPDSLHINRVEDGLILAVSRGFTEMFGHAPDEAIGRSTLELGCWAHPGERVPIVERLRREGVLHNVDALFRSRSGRVFAGVLSTTLLELHGVEHAITSVRDVSAQQQAERTLRSNEEKFRRAFDLNPSAMSMTRLKDGVFLAVNQGYQNIVGYSEDELVGRSAVELGIWPTSEERDRMIGILNAQQQMHDYPARLQRRDGRMIDVEISGAVIDLDGVPHGMWNTRPAGEQRRLLDALRRSEERFRRMFELAPEAVTLTRVRDGIVVAVNQSYSALSGYSAADAIGRTTLELEHWVDAAERAELIERLQQEGTVRDYRARFQTRTGRRIDARVTATFVDIDGEPHLLALITDSAAAGK